MAIRKRPAPTALDNAAIEAFGDAADVRAEPSRATKPTATSGAQLSAGEGTWPEGISKTFLLRYPDASIPVAIEELQDLIGRNKHQTVLLALRRGIDALRREAEELGERAELLK